MRYKISQGDVFRFSSSPNTWGYGQVLRSNILQYIIIFEPNFLDTAIIGDIIRSKSLLSGWTSDARFLSGDWERMGNKAPVGKFLFPNYQILMSGQTWVTDVDGELLRLATHDEVRSLPFRSSESPIAFEKAFKAHHGDMAWESRFEQLRVKK